MSTNEWLDSYQQRVTDIAQTAEQAKAQLQQVSSTLNSADGAVTVTVNASGALQNLSFGPKADDLSRTELAAAVLDAARRAQVAAAHQVTEVMTPLIGGDSDAMAFLREQLPGSGEDTGASDRDDGPRDSFLGRDS